jgi:alpha-glucosidase
MFFRTSLAVWLALFTQDLSGQSLVGSDRVHVPAANALSWWAGIIDHGFQMPMESGYSANAAANNYGNQVQPLFLSNQGEVIWSDEAFTVDCQPAGLTIESKSGKVYRTKAGTTLREAFCFASKQWFPPSGKAPDELLFSSPQYNTWIELMYNQNQVDILKYARAIRDHGFPPGVLMIDDNWQEDYGKWDFHRGRFSDAKAMVDTLHRNGFKVMLWVCPFVSPDSDVGRELAEKRLLLRDATGQPAVVRWWNGASALLDLTNPGAIEWFRARLDYLQSTYQVDGFKFDGGDSSFYTGLTAARSVSPDTHSELFGKLGLHYPLNEYRAMWKMGGQPLAQRLRDKNHSWVDLQRLVPNMILEGLMGYSFSCPDMIGGGEFRSFLNLATIDQELIVRSAQCHALMPMMQFSVAPWRVLDSIHLEAVQKAIAVRNRHMPYLLQLVKHSAATGEPIVRSLEYVFPHQGYERVKDQFLLGDTVLVAPVLEKGAAKREVVFPKGEWKGFDGKRYRGPGKYSVAVALDEVCFFEKSE